QRHEEGGQEWLFFGVRRFSSLRKRLCGWWGTLTRSVSEAGTDLADASGSCEYRPPALSAALQNRTKRRPSMRPPPGHIEPAPGHVRTGSAGAGLRIPFAQALAGENQFPPAGSGWRRFAGPSLLGLLLLLEYGIFRQYVQHEVAWAHPTGFDQIVYLSDSY